MDDITKKVDQTNSKLVFDDYKSVFYTLHSMLDNAVDANSFPYAPEKNTCSEYSSLRPAFDFYSNGKHIFYVIEIGHSITNEIIQSWITLSKKCDYIFIIVPKDILEVVKGILVKEISNYFVYPFYYILKGRNIREVKLDLGL